MHFTLVDDNCKSINVGISESSVAPFCCNSSVYQAKNVFVAKGWVNISPSISKQLTLLVDFSLFLGMIAKICTNVATKLVDCQQMLYRFEQIWGHAAVTAEAVHCRARRVESCVLDCFLWSGV